MGKGLTNARRDLAEALAAGGETGRLIAAHDWEATPLGPIETWPGPLCTIVATMLTCPEATHVTWGPELTQLYNDAYIPVLGPAKHPAMGISVRDAFAESWDDVVGPRYLRPLRDGEPFSASSLLLPMDRHGWLEETHFAGSYSPLRDEDGRVAGVLTVCTETTDHVVGQRRMRLLAELGAELAFPQTFEELFESAVTRLTTSQDACAAVVAGGDGVVLAAAGLSLERGARLDPAVLGGADRQGRVAFAALGASPTAHPGWPWPPEHAWVVRVGDSWLVVGCHPGLAFDDAHEQFMALVADIVRGAVVRVEQLEQTRRRLVELQRLDRLKDALLSDVSHELRTPLTLVGGALQQLRTRDDLTDDDRTLLWETAHRSVDRLGRQVETLLSYGRLASGHLTAQLEPVDLVAATSDMVRAFLPEFERVGLGLDLDVPSAPVAVNLDVDLWETVVFNLLSNAFRCTLEGSVTVQVHPGPDDVTVRMSDTGVGIPEDELDRLFDRFHRVRGRPTRTEEGSGIGLALVAAVVAEHQGTIHVDSELDVGTTFTIRLPHAVQAADTTIGGAPQPPAHSSASAPDPTSDVRRGRVLLVDDNEDLLQLMQMALLPHHDVEVASNGMEARDRLAAADIDVLVTDAMMPVMDGGELIAHLRDDPANGHVPVVLLTGQGVEDAVPGANVVLAKPFGFPELVEVIARLRGADPPR